MARFVFRLESVLRDRLRVERERQRDLAIIEAQIATFESELAAIGQTTQASLDDLRQNHLIGRIDVTFLTAHRRYMFAVQRKTHAIEAEIALAAERATTARAGLAQAAMNRKMLEKLREKQKQLWLEDQSRKESDEANEVGMRIAFAANTAQHDVEPCLEENALTEMRAQMQRENET